MPTTAKQTSDPMIANAIVRHEQVGVVVRDPAVEPEAIGQVVSQRDQPRVQRHLRQGVAMDRKGRAAEPAAHPGQSIGRSGAKTRA